MGGSLFLTLHYYYSFWLTCLVSEWGQVVVLAQKLVDLQSLVSNVVVVVVVIIILLLLVMIGSRLEVG